MHHDMTLRQRFFSLLDYADRSIILPVIGLDIKDLLCRNLHDCAVVYFGCGCPSHAWLPYYRVHSLHQLSLQFLL